MSRKKTLPPLYAITDRKLARRDTHLEIVRELIRGGATLIQIREKELDAYDLYQQARRAVDYAHRRGVRIIINDRVDLALAVGADGVHLGQEDLPPQEARQLLGPRKLIGYSTHNWRQAVRAESEPVDYIAVGPLFATTTKESSNPALGVAIIRKLKRRLTKPLVGIGGITLGTLPALFSAGLDTVAVISDLLSRGDMARRTRAYISAIEQGWSKDSMMEGEE